MFGVFLKYKIILKLHKLQVINKEGFQASFKKILQ